MALLMFSVRDLSQYQQTRWISIYAKASWSFFFVYRLHAEHTLARSSYNQDKELAIVTVWNPNFWTTMSSFIILFATIVSGCMLCLRIELVKLYPRSTTVWSCLSTKTRQITKVDSSYLWTWTFLQTWSKYSLFRSNSINLEWYIFLSESKKTAELKLSLYHNEWVVECLS